jgi:growth factor-regulated tyrosine kinase substrate
MSTHPIASPSSAKSALPTNGLPGPNGSSYTSPSVTNGQLPQVSPQKQQYHQLPQPQQPQPQQTQHVYYDASFPPAPAAVFPDAPQSEFEQPQHSQTQGVEKQEKEEALLIEL